jgi:hypothetical protein
MALMEKFPNRKPEIPEEAALAPHDQSRALSVDESEVSAILLAPPFVRFGSLADMSRLITNVCNMH